MSTLSDIPVTTRHLSCFVHGCDKSSMPAEPDCSSKLDTAGRNRELQAYLMGLDDVDLNEDGQDRLFTEFTINTVYASYAAAQSRVRQYTQLLVLLKREEDEWARKVEKASNILPDYKPKWVLQT
ncbi:uncharacterized protein HD556DRAFT_1304852 [Suillus plorans]|uniref:Uncharacterized protein n=1 Tax=Suillus plorans TaxID=116603 RepID=A0A9P7DQY7_9AGAM|nr:uncharacterized protein HD556DRAFT_1304852 [Suillus plorans]KAG1800865.1 hypothetical protein HD556DRAFT_1304852 [Suillus plorans]